MDKRRLSGYVSLGKEIEQAMEEIARLESALLSPPLPKNDGMPRSTGHVEDRLAAGVAKLVDLIAALDRKIELWTAERLEIEAAISVLDSADRLLLRYRYINGLPFYAVADKMDYSTQAIYYRHKKALKRLE